MFLSQTDSEAARLFTSLQQAVINLRSGRPGPLPPPVDDINENLDERSHLILQSVLSCAVVGSSTTVKAGLKTFVDRYRPDEVMATAQIFDHTARLRSFELLAGI